VAAGKSRKSRSVTIDRSRYGSRRTCMRPPLPVIVVVCDDTRTAVAYFGVLKRRVKEKLTLRVEPKPHDRASADEVVAHAHRGSAASSDARRHATRTKIRTLFGRS
jgi:hypothetical protein